MQVIHSTAHIITIHEDIGTWLPTAKVIYSRHTNIATSAIAGSTRKYVNTHITLKKDLTTQSDRNIELIFT